MPKSKNKRKNGKATVQKNKRALSAIFLKQSAIDDVRQIFVEAQLKAEMKLGTGQCTFDDVALIRDCLNAGSWCLIYLDRITGDLNEEWFNSIQETFSKSKDAFHTFYWRGNNKGGVKDPTVRYVCTGDELTAIKDGVQVSCELIDDMLTNRPSIFLSLFFGMKKFLKGRGTGRLEFTAAELEKAIRKYAGR